MKSAFNIVLRQDACEPICFKPGIVLDTTEVYSMALVLTTLIFSQCHRIMGKLELVKLYGEFRTFSMVDYI